MERCTVRHDDVTGSPVKSCADTCGSFAQKVDTAVLRPVISKSTVVESISIELVQRDESPGWWHDNWYRCFDGRRLSRNPVALLFFRDTVPMPRMQNLVDPLFRVLLVSEDDDVEGIVSLGA